MINKTRTKPKAKIINARIENRGDSDVVIGYCTEHAGRPELVGQVIHTSRIVKIDGALVETRNSIYEVEWE